MDFGPESKSWRNLSPSAKLMQVICYCLPMLRSVHSRIQARQPTLCSNTLQIFVIKSIATNRKISATTKVR
jgi:hypothetical protein